MERMGFGFDEATEEIDTGSGWANIDLFNQQNDDNQDEIEGIDAPVN